jgi:hypothetical protein
VLATNFKESDQERYPGDDENSFGFGSDGCVYHKGMSFPYVWVRYEACETINTIDLFRYLGLKDEKSFFNSLKTWGIIVDLYHGSLSLVVDGKEYPPAFGRGAREFSLSEQEAQR